MVELVRRLDSMKIFIKDAAGRTSTYDVDPSAPVQVGLLQPQTATGGYKAARLCCRFFWVPIQRKRGLLQESDYA